MTKRPPIFFPLLLAAIGAYMVIDGNSTAISQRGRVNFLADGLRQSWMAYFDGWGSHREYIIGAILIGIGVGLFAVLSGWFDTKPQMGPRAFWSIAAAFALFEAWFICHFGMQQFGGYDSSNTIDSSWRLIHGQIAYQDFPFTLPVGYTLGGKWAFQLFGVRWASFIYMTAMFAIPSFLWSLWLFERLFGRSLTVLLWAASMQIFSMMMASIWVYNPMTQMAAVIFALSAVWWLKKPKLYAPAYSYLISLLLLATMKPNIAGILAIGVSAIFFPVRNIRPMAIGASMMAFLFFLWITTANNLNFFGTLSGFLSVAHRGASLAPFMNDLDATEKCCGLLILAVILVPAMTAIAQGYAFTPKRTRWLPAIAMLAGLCLFILTGENKLIGETTIFLPVLLAVCLGRRALAPPNNPAIWISLCLLLAGLYGFVTDSEQKLTDMPTILCVAILIIWQFKGFAVGSNLPGVWNRYIAFACIALSALGIAQAIAHDRCQSSGPVQFFEFNDSEVIDDGFFKGLRCGRVFKETLRETANALAWQPATNVWFGPRMQWGYAAFNKPSPLHEPVIWDPNTMFDSAKEKTYFQNFLTARHDLLILFKNDLSNYTDDEVHQIERRYSVNQQFPLLTICKIK
jgi:hypothetical protein